MVLEEGFHCARESHCVVSVSIGQALSGRRVHSVAFVLSCPGPAIQLTASDDKVRLLFCGCWHSPSWMLCTVQSLFFTYFVSCNGLCAPKEKLHRKEHFIIIIIIIITWVVRGIGEGDMRDDSAEILSQSFSWEAVVSRSGIGWDVRCLTLSIQHFLLSSSVSHTPSKVLWRTVLERLAWHVSAFSYKWQWQMLMSDSYSLCVGSFFWLCF